MTRVQENGDIAALLGSRICHDLISPIGAIGNGLELMSMLPGSNSPEFALIAESVAHANARIRFFRIAFGAAGEARQSLGEIRTIIAEMTQGSRLSVDWNSRNDLARVEVKLGFLMILCLESALPYGGRIAVAERGGHWKISAEAERFRLDPAPWALLSDPAATAELTPGIVQFPLAAAEFARAGRKLGTEFGERAIRLSY